MNTTIKTKPGRPRNAVERDAHISFKVPAATRDAWQARAALERRTLTAVIERAMGTYLARIAEDGDCSREATP